MNEEGKEAIKELKHYVNITPHWKLKEYTFSEVDNYIKTTLNYIEKLEKENKNADERNYSLGLDFIQIGEKLGLDSFGIQTILSGIEKLQKVIDLMVKEIAKAGKGIEIINLYNNVSPDKPIYDLVKEYFYKKAEEQK